MLDQTTVIRFNRGNHTAAAENTVRFLGDKFGCIKPEKTTLDEYQVRPRVGNRQLFGAGLKSLQPVRLSANLTAVQLRESATVSIDGDDGCVAASEQFSRTVTPAAGQFDDSLTLGDIGVAQQTATGAAKP